MKSNFKRIHSLLLSLLMLILTATPAAAQTPRLDDAPQVEAFLDGVIAAQMGEHHVPGGIVAVVQGGKVIVAKGYGYAELARHTPVSADQTLFRMASVSKLFVWTAVMQLVEQGKLDLDADVNTYLKAFQIPATYPQPITLAHLMAHTAGFEEKGIGTLLIDGKAMTPLAQYLQTQMPARVMPPGLYSAYSNYGAALAGYIVAQVAGMPFEEYVAQQIFAPLGMTHSTFQQPAPAQLAAALATGFHFDGSANQPASFEYIAPSPAGALSSTAVDMARFMLAHLQDGALDGARILQPETAQLMHRQHFAHDARVSGMAHGFAESTMNGQHIIWHKGDTLYFHSALLLFPAADAGLFLSFNSDQGDPVIASVLRAWMDRFFPIPPTVESAGQPTLLPGFTERAGQVVGSYLPTRRNFTTGEKITGMFNAFNVTQGKDGALYLAFGVPAQRTARLIERSPYVFTPKDETGGLPEQFVFKVNADGSVVLLMANNPTVAFIRQPWYSVTTLHLWALGGGLLLFLITLIVSPVAGLVNRRWRVRQPLPAQIATWLVSVAGLAAWIYVIAVLAAVMNDESVFGLPAYFKVVGLGPWLVLILTPCIATGAVLSWVKSWWGLPRRCLYSVTALGSLAFVWWMVYWNALIAL